MKYLSTQGLKREASEVRQDVIRMIASAGSGHPGGSLGIVDVIVALYFRIMSHNPDKPNWKDRDR